MLNQKQAEYFLEIVNCGSITEAAKNLFISQPALSQTIKNIENELQFPLFIRGTSPLQLTKMGERMLPIARNIISFNHNIEKQIKALQELPTHTLRIGVLSGQAQGIITHILTDYIASHPQVEVSITETGSHVIEQLLMDGKIDIGVLSGAPTNSSFNYVFIRNDTMVVLAPKTSDFAKRHANASAINFDELYDQQLVAKTIGSYSRLLLDTLSHLYGIPLKIKYEFENLAPIVPNFPKLGCLTFLPISYYNVTPELYETSNYYYINCSEIHYSEFLCFHKSLHISDYISDLLDVMQKHLAQANKQ